MSEPSVPPPPQQPEPTPEPYSGAVPPPLPGGKAPAVPPAMSELIAGPPGPPAEAHAVPAAPVVPTAPLHYTAPAFEMPSPRAVPIDYQFPGTKPPGSQWATDDQAYGGCMISALLVLAFIGAVIGAIWWVISLFVTG